MNRGEAENESLVTQSYRTCFKRKMENTLRASTDNQYFYCKPSELKAKLKEQQEKNCVRVCRGVAGVAL